MTRHLRWIFVAAIMLPGWFPATSQRIGVELHLGVRLKRQLEGPTSDQLRVSLKQGEFLKIEVMQVGTDVAVALIDPQNLQLTAIDSPNGLFGPETIVAIAENDGEHKIEVKLSNPTKRGSYEVSLLELRGANLQDKEVIAAHRLLTEGQVMRVRNAADARNAVKLYEKAAEIFAKLSDRYYQALNLRIAGSLHAGAGNITKALELSKLASSLFHEIGSCPTDEADAQNLAGGMLDVLGNPREALQAFRLALDLYKQVSDLPSQAMVLNNMGKVEKDLGNWQGALDHYKLGLAVAKKAGDLRREALLLNNTAHAYVTLGELDEAMGLFEEALPKRRAVVDRRGEGDTLRAMAVTFSLMKQPVKALEYFEKALSIYMAIGDKRAEAVARSYLAKTYFDLGNLPKTEELLKEVLVLQKTIQDRRITAITRYEMSRTLLKGGHHTAAEEQAKQALAEFRTIGDRNNEAGALESIARIKSEQDNLPEARKRMEEALLLHEANRSRTDSQQLRASFFADRQDSYAFYIDLLMRMKLDTVALEVNEKSRARSLIEMLSESGAGVQSGVDPKLRQREREISESLNAAGARLLPLLGRETPQVAALKKDITRLEAEYRDVQADIRKSNPHYAELTQPRLLSVKQAQDELLDADTLLLEYSLGEKRSYLWVVSKNELHTHELPARDVIEAQVLKVQELLFARSTNVRMESAKEREKRIAQADAALGPAARQLSDMILGPAGALLQGKRLAIVPDGALQRIPFAMLPIPGKADPLVALHEIAVLPSASALAVMRNEFQGRQRAPKMLAVFADPVFDRADPRNGRGTPAIALARKPENSRVLEHPAEAGTSELVPAAMQIARLPFTRQEADQILSISKDASNLRAMDFQASRATAISGQLSDYRYLHFATHGYLDTERPSLSALVLSQLDETGQTRDGFLRVNDIYNTRLSAELVVLSACQTGLGKEVRGEGLMGLTRAFLYAGVPRVIVSLWNVNDRATAGLMTDMYRRILREGKRPTAALREAQLELRKQKRWESPYYWAAFVQHGEWK